MNDLSSYLPTADKVAEVIDYMMTEEIGLAAPENYELLARDGRVYLVASYNPMLLGKSMKVYENPDIARRLRMALDGLPVEIASKTGMRYGVLMSGKVRLPKEAVYPASQPVEKDIFRLGMGLQGEIRHHARELLNVVIGAPPGSGKSNILKLFAHQMRFFGWKLFLADSQMHTFNPDIWNSLAACPVAGSANDMLALLDALESELATRVMQFRMVNNGGLPPNDIDEYNRLGVGEPMPRIGFLADEVNGHLANKAIFRRVAEALRVGRKWGLHIFLAGHEWHKETISAEINDMLQTRIALSASVEESARVILRSSHWSKWVMDKGQGRGVLKLRGFTPMQFYRVPEDLERQWLIGTIAPSPFAEGDLDLIKRSLAEVDGKFTIEVLQGFGLSFDKARDLTTTWETRGWLAKDRTRGNARYLTPEVRRLAEMHSNPQAAQTAQTGTNPLVLGSNRAQTAQSAEA